MLDFIHKILGKLKEENKIVDYNIKVNEDDGRLRVGIQPNEEPEFFFFEQ